MPFALYHAIARSLRLLSRLRHRSLLRAILLALASLVSTILLAGFPAPSFPRPSGWQFLSVLLAAWSMTESFRCLDRQWSLYHAGVLILEYACLMLLILALFLWIYP